jgi:hypothetical protein
MNYADAKKGEIIGNFKCIGQIKNGLWAAFKPDNSQDWTQQQQLEWQQENQRRQQQKAKEDERRRQRSLSAVERDKGYRQVLSELTLHPDDKADLVRRGFSHAQIELSGFRSVEAYRHLQGQYSELLPGIVGGKVIISNEGYLCPVRNTEGLIIACQVRLRSLSNGDTNRYRWLSTKEQTLHVEGELPLAIFPSGVSSEVVALAEGTGPKPFLVSQRLGLTTIGAAGGQFLSSPHALKKGIGDARSVLALPDAGDVANPSVMNRWQKVAELLKGWGYEVKFGWWGQTDKTHLDIDELEDLSTVQYISPSEFFNLGQSAPTAKGFSQFAHEKKVINVIPGGKSKSASNWKKYIKPIKELPKIGFDVIRRSQDEVLERFDALKTKRGQEWVKLREFTPDVVIDSKYFDYNAQPGENLAVKSGLGTGKSHFTNAKWLADPKYGAVLGGYRNCLNEQFCANGEKLNGRPWYQIQQDLKGGKDLSLLADPTSRIAGAVDSWIYFSPDHFDGKKVIFDEVESVAKHLNQSNTAVSYYRETIKSRISDALQNSSANLIADGNLRDFTVQYFEQLSGRKFKKVLNTYKGNRGKIYLYNGSVKKKKATEKDVENGLASQVGEWITYDNKQDDYSQLHRIMMDLPIEISMLILSDSQAKCEAWDRKLSAIGRKVFRLDSTTSTTDLGRLFLRDPKKFILEEKIDVVILSPSAESGVSIEMPDDLHREIPGYFKYEFAFFFGTSTTDTQIQFLGRNRDQYVTKFVYIQSHSLPQSVRITDHEDSNDIVASSIATMMECASLSLEGLEDDEILKIAIKKIEAQLACPHLRYEAKLMLKESFERAFPRLCFEYAAREAGWEVTVIESKGDDSSDLMEIQQEIRQEECKAIFASETVSPSEADLLAKKQGKIPDERRKVEKSRLLTRLPGIEEKVFEEAKKVKTVEQVSKIEQSKEKIVSVAGLPLEEWKASSQPISEKGVEILTEKSAFSPDFIDKVKNQDRGFIPRLESLFFLNNPELCKLTQQHKWYKKLDLLTDPDSPTEGLPIARYRSRWLEINTLREMGIDFFLNPENSWHGESPEAIAFCEKGKIPRNARNIGVKHIDNPCAYIGEVLNKFGLKTKNKQKTKDGIRYREYSIKPIDSLSQVAYECVTRRINDRVSDLNFDWKKIIKNAEVKTFESHVVSESHPAHPLPDSLIEIRGGVCIDKPENETLALPLVKLISALEVVGSADEFASVIEGSSVEVVEDAILYLESPHQKQRLQQWYESLKQASKRPALASYAPGDEVWAYFPQSQSGWLKGVVEWARGNTIRVVSGFFGIHVGQEDAIAPGDWVLSS